jgi:hypothetical protein
MNISLTIKDSLYAKELDAVAAMGGWTDTVPDPVNPGVTIPNPVTKEQFFKRQVKQWARNQALEHANRTALASIALEEDS